MKSVSAAKTISARELLQATNAGEKLFLIDVLTEDHFRKKHLPEAQNVCVFKVVFVDEIQRMIPDTQARIVLYGEGGIFLDAITAAEKLTNIGYQQVEILDGGIAAWIDKGFPLEGEDTSSIPDPETLLSLEDGSYTVDAGASVIHWQGRNANKSHFGTIRLAGGKLEVQTGMMNGLFEIDMNSIECIDLKEDPLYGVLLHHLRSDDFFLTERFPKARFVIEHGKPVEKPYLTMPNYTIDGVLELKGVQSRQGFTAIVNQSPEIGLKLEAHFDIDRTKWNVLYGSTRFFAHLGMHAVFDMISIEMRIVASRQTMG